MQILILVATQSGTATMVADELLADLEDRGHTATVQKMDDADPGIFQQDAIFLVVTSSYGEGDLPERARPFYARLAEERPDLTAVRYGVFGLGDAKGHGPTYCGGPKKIDGLLTELGAMRIGELECHDLWSKTYVEDHALEWLDNWLTTVEE